ncbi:WXG100 family type VII secretion target [Paenibacillus sp. JX-17]|uniref:WXG100 family type VII secretion target n=1 Tax=Paenibacillus lacisoli TaxID=3064525 RepID=A0ABT9C8Y0_9BACL|nr:WXG100 family type VII secretion target [Paenibacillus sp. JX-17]MDO7905720.1 WXG100 family type VII secretion target [Paenibacillus sp. JX-17]
MRIRIEPDVLRTLGSQLQHAAEQIQQVTAGLERALQSLEWDVNVREVIWNEWQQCKRLSEYIHSQLRSLGIHIHHKADQFQQADQDYHSFMTATAAGMARPASMLGMVTERTLSIFQNSGMMGGGTVSDPSSVMNVIAIHKDGESHPVWGDQREILQHATLQTPQPWVFKDPSGAA